jgi:hypothetical protein
MPTLQSVTPGTTPSRPGLPVFPTTRTPEHESMSLDMSDKIKSLLVEDDSTLVSTVSSISSVKDVEWKNEMVTPFYSRLSEHVAVAGEKRIVAGVLDVLLPYLPNLVSAQVPGLLGTIKPLTCRVSKGNWGTAIFQSSSGQETKEGDVCGICRRICPGVSHWL